MSLSDKVTSDIKEAMKAKDKIVLEALRAAKTAFTLARTEKSSDTILTEEEELKIIQKLVKQRKDSARIYKEQSREDLFKKEIAEADVLERYLPAKLSSEELENVVRKIIQQLGVSGTNEMGKVMGVATKQLAGKADGRAIADMVRELLT